MNHRHPGATKRLKRLLIRGVAAGLLAALSALFPAEAAAPACPWFNPPPPGFPIARDVDPRWARMGPLPDTRSMHPMFGAGAMLLVELWVREPRPCEVVVFRCGHETLVHQVIRLEYGGNEVEGVTWSAVARGANNGDVDSCRATEATMVGVVRGVLY